MRQKVTRDNLNIVVVEKKDNVVKFPTPQIEVKKELQVGSLGCCRASKYDWKFD